MIHTVSFSWRVDAPTTLPDGLPAQPNRFYRLLLILVGHALLLAAVYSALYCFGIVDWAPDETRLLNWDAHTYLTIAEDGYSKEVPALSAFFPLFPWFWRLTGFEAVGISVCNGLLALAGAGILAWGLRMTGRQLLLLLSAPTMFYCLVPYGEALFFFFSVLTLVGLHRRNLPLTLVGLLGSCLARSAGGAVFAVAYTFAELLAWQRGERLWPLLRNLLLGWLTTALGVGGYMYLLYRTTGDALSFLHVRVQWRQEMRWPNFPLSTSAGINMLWEDYLSLAIGIIAAGACVWLGLRWLRSLLTGRRLAGVPKVVLFSLVYCLSVTYFVVANQGGDLVGMSRYQFATPFVGVLIWYASSWPVSLIRIWGPLLAICLVTALMLGFPTHFTNFLAGEACWYFGLATATLLGWVYAARQREPAYREVFAGLYMAHLVLQVGLFSVFLDRGWIG